MSIVTNRWRPDTCGCIFEYTWDTNDPAESRVHTLSKVVNKCAIHSALSDAQMQYDTILEENRRKNNILTKFYELVVENYDVITYPDGSQSVELKAGKALNWSFDASRVLTVTAIGFTNQQKNRAKNWLTANNITNIVIV